MDERYECPGCRATTDSAAAMERHEASCIPALRAALEARDASIARLIVRVAELEANAKRRDEFGRAAAAYHARRRAEEND